MIHLTSVLSVLYIQDNEVNGDVTFLGKLFNRISVLFTLWLDKVKSLDLWLYNRKLIVDARKQKKC